MRFTTAIEHGERYAVLTVTGELDLASAPRLRDALLVLANDSGLSAVYIDCAELDFIDSTGMGLFVAVHRRFSEAGVDLVLANVRSGPGRPLQTTGLASLLDVRWHDGPAQSPWRDDDS